MELFLPLTVCTITGKLLYRDSHWTTGVPPGLTISWVTMGFKVRHIIYANCEALKLVIIITIRYDWLPTLYLLYSNHEMGVNPTTSPNRIGGLKFLTTEKVLCQTLKCFTRIKSGDNKLVR